MTVPVPQPIGARLTRIVSCDGLIRKQAQTIGRSCRRQTYRRTLAGRAYSGVKSIARSITASTAGLA